MVRYASWIENGEVESVDCHKILSKVTLWSLVSRAAGQVEMIFRRAVIWSFLKLIDPALDYIENAHVFQAANDQS